MGYSSLAIANEFIRRANAEGVGITQMHLQKFVYLAHGWNLAVNETPLIEDDIEAWEYGPVIRRLYDAIRKHGKDCISSPIRWGDDTPFSSDDDGVASAQLNDKEVAVIDRVWSLYKKFQAFQLSALTHENGSPWASLFEKGKNKVISDNLIKSYFVNLANNAA